MPVINAPARWGRMHAALGLGIPVLVAAAFRLPGLGTWSLWADEAATAAFMSVGWWALIDPLARLETTPPSYYMLLMAWTQVAGTSDLALRVPSALAGIGSVAVLWRLCRDAFGHRAAFWAAMTLAVTGWHIFHSRDARVYALLALMLLLALVTARAFAARAAQPGSRWVVPAICLAGLAASAAWLHFAGTIAAATAFVYAGALIVAGGALHRQAMLRLAASALLCGVLMLPVLWLAWSIAQADGQAGFGWMNRIGFALAGRTMFRVLFLAPSTLDPWVVVGPAAAGLAATAVLVTLWRALRPGARSAEVWALGAALLGGIVLILVAHAIKPIILTRTLLILVPLVAALAGVGISRLRPAALHGAAFGTFLLSQAPALYDTFTVPPDASDWRRLGERIAAASGPDSAVLTFDAFEATALDRYRTPDGPRVAYVLLPPGEVGLHHFITTRVTTALPVTAETLLAALCRDGPAPRLLVGERDNEVLEDQREMLAAALSGTGTVTAPTIWDRSLGLRIWSPPDCAAQSTTARP